MNLFLFAAIICLLWAVQPLCQKYILKQLTPGSMVAYSSMFFIFVQVFYIIYFYDDAKSDWKKLNWKMILLMFITTVICSSLAGFLFLKLLKEYQNSYLINAITASYPIITTFLAWYIFKEDVGWQGLLGSVLIVIGLILLCLKAKNTPKNDPVSTQEGFLTYFIPNQESNKKASSYSLPSKKLQS